MLSGTRHKCKEIKETEITVSWGVQEHLKRKNVNWNTFKGRRKLDSKGEIPSKMAWKENDMNWVAQKRQCQVLW